MVSLLPKLSTRLPELVRAARSDLLIVSPYVGSEGTELIARSLSADVRNEGRLQFLTDLSPLNICQSSTDPSAILGLSREFRASTVVHLPRIHAKVFVADNVAAIITSANLTRGGLSRNYEYGVEVRDTRIVAQIRADLIAYAAFGANVEPPELAAYCEMADELRVEYAEAERAASRKFRVRLRAAQDELIRLRLHGAVMHTVFARTIEYLLHRNDPMSTKSLNLQVAHIHPDLCDDSIDRVIDGQHFGKKWKHAVRTAQQDLKRQGVINNDGRLWQIVERESPNG